LVAYIVVLVKHGQTNIKLPTAIPISPCQHLMSTKLIFEPFVLFLRTRVFSGSKIFPHIPQIRSKFRYFP